MEQRRKRQGDTENVERDRVRQSKPERDRVRWSEAERQSETQGRRETE